MSHERRPTQFRGIPILMEGDAYYGTSVNLKALHILYGEKHGIYLPPQPDLDLYWVGDGGSPEACLLRYYLMQGGERSAQQAKLSYLSILIDPGTSLAYGLTMKSEAFDALEADDWNPKLLPHRNPPHVLVVLERALTLPCHRFGMVWLVPLKDLLAIRTADALFKYTTLLSLCREHVGGIGYEYIAEWCAAGERVELLRFNHHAMMLKGKWFQLAPTDKIRDENKREKGTVLAVPNAVYVVNGALESPIFGTETLNGPHLLIQDPNLVLLSPPSLDEPAAPTSE